MGVFNFRGFTVAFGRTPTVRKALSGVDSNRGGWIPLIKEPYAGSMWHCEASNTDIRPGRLNGAEAYWKLAVKRGRRAKAIEHDSEAIKQREVDAAWAQHRASDSGATA